MEQVNLKCGALHHVKRNTGKFTDCIFAKLLHNNMEYDLTYDCISDKLVIHEWYQLSSDELAEMQDELKKVFSSMK